MADRKTNYLVPQDSNDQLSMPNIEQAISNEIDRLTLEVIDEVTEFFNVGITFNTIEYIENELKPEFSLDYYVNNLRDSLYNSITNALNFNGNEYEYFKLFKVIDYNNNTGKANVQIEIPLNNIDIQNIKINNIKKK